MMKKLFLVLAMVASACAWAESEVVDGVTWYYETNWYVDHTLEVVTYAYVTSGADKYSGDLVVPNTLGGYKVTGIGDSAFYSCSSLTSVTIPEGVSSIGGWAFYNCSSLTSVTMPEGVTSIGGSAFENCRSLASMAIPQSVTSIGGHAFFGCSSLVSVTIPSSVTSVGGSAFSGCSSLTSVTIPEGVSSIGGWAFYNCSSLERFDVPASVTSMGEHVIRGCDSLTVITVAEGNANYKCVNNCIVSASGTTLIAVPFGCEDVDIPEGVTEIPVEMFYGNIVLEYVTIPSSARIIGGNAFNGCDSLLEVSIPEGVTSVGKNAFSSCDSLISVDLPSSLKDIGDDVFGACAALTSICIPYGIESIGYGMFSSCGSLLEIEIPSSVTSIGCYAFYNCSSLASVTIPDGVTSIGEMAFEYCWSLESVVIPASVTSIGREAFRCQIYHTTTAFKDVTFLGAPPSGVENSGLLSKQNISYPREYGAAWMKLINDVNKFRGYNRKQPEVTVVSSKIRASDPTILDVVYKVTSSQPTVKVRALAFEDGVRSFANVVRPETFVGDTNGVATAGNVGDAIVPNVEHTLSWRVASDWSNRLAKVTFEVLASEGDLLPLEVRTIPASEQYGKMDVTWNAITESQWFDALMWLYADKNKKVTVSKGICYYDGKKVKVGNGSIGSYSMDVQEVVLGEMGYTLLTGDVLNYVNDETRLGLSPSGYRQYGYRIVGE